MTIFVGSTNQAKINAVKKAVQPHLSEAVIIPTEVTTGVNEQPKTDAETRQGAKNRAEAALKSGLADVSHKVSDALGIGLEGGIFEDAEGMWSTVWACVVTTKGEVFESNGARIKLPEIIAKKIRNGGEMGPVVDALLQKNGHASVRQNHGMIGVVTNNFTDRIEEYATIAKLALGLWYGRNWQNQLKK